VSPGFGALNRERSDEYRKDSDTEGFLARLNRALLPLEQSLYRDLEPLHPFVFVFGVPRSGTTLLSQLLAHCLDLGYVDNLAARFWLAPVCGVRLSRAVLDRDAYTGFRSDYGSTSDIRDIHEFGYFWMHWLQKDSFEDIRDAKELEEEIDWSGLRRVLANVQEEFSRGIVAKNIYGSYHMARLSRSLGDVLWVRIRRDELDSAVSILEARRKYYDDASAWWSYVPPEYEKVIDAEPRRQIAGQIHYLRKFWDEETDHPEVRDRVLEVEYEAVCRNPRGILERVREILEERFESSAKIAREPPEGFEPRSHDRPEEKARFRDLLRRFREDTSNG
jgi:LPS sulfotransferase NodH